MDILEAVQLGKTKKAMESTMEELIKELEFFIRKSPEFPGDKEIASKLGTLSGVLQGLIDSL